MSAPTGSTAAPSGASATSFRPRSRASLLFGAGALTLGTACYIACGQMRETPWTQGYKVVKAYAHDPDAYCQGLVFDDGVLHESTGRNGKSSVRTVELETGKVLKKTDLPYDFFGEGLAQVGDHLIQITWQEGVARVYDRNTLLSVYEFEYQGEGWGLAFDGTNLVMSDGSPELVFRDPKTFKEVRRVTVHMKGLPLKDLNELEVVEGEVWANVWHQDYIARIDPRTGDVLGVIDLAGIIDRQSIPDPEAVLNGIAYDPKAKRIFVTGKLWPKLFEIELVAK